MTDLIQRIDGTVGIRVNRFKIAELRQFLHKNPDATVTIASGATNEAGKNIFTDKNLDMVKDLDIKRLLIIGHQIEDFSGISFLKNLEYLDTSIVLDFEFDFKNNKKIKHLELIWNKGIKNLNLLTNLESLRILKYKSETRDLIEFDSLKNLNTLTLNQSNVTSIETLNNLSKLTTLTLAYCKDVKFENSKQSAFLNIKSLEIEKCSSIDFTFIPAFPNITELHIQNQPPIETLRPILSNLTKLKKLTVLGTKIIESDNRYWKDFKNIEQLVFNDMRHHILKQTDFI